MKKILSLLVVSMLVLGCFSMTAFAADFGYNLHTFASGSNAMNSDGIIPLFVRSVGETLGGYIEIQYDSTKVTPVVYSEYEDEDTGETVVNISDATASTLGKDVVVSVNATKVDDGCTLDFANSKIKANFFSTSGLANNKQAIKIYFKALDKTTDNWNEKTFVVTDAYVEDTANTPAEFADITLTKTYANASVPAVDDNKWEAGEEAITDEFKAGLANVKVNGVAVDYVRAVAVFGKNAAGTTYTVKFGANTYEGEAVAGKPWAMVLYDDGSADHDLIGDVESYAYTVTADDTTWSGSATVFTK